MAMARVILVAAVMGMSVTAHALTSANTSRKAVDADIVGSSGGALNVVSTDTVVSATDLDIRDLTSASDSVEVLQDTHDDLNLNANIQVGNADVANGNPVPVSDAGGSLTVDAVDLDIRDLLFASDSINVTGSTVTIDDGGGSITVDGTVATTAVEVATAEHSSAAVAGSAIAIIPSNASREFFECRIACANQDSDSVFISMDGSPATTASQDVGNCSSFQPPLNYTGLVSVITNGDTIAVSCTEY